MYLIFIVLLLFAAAYAAIIMLFFVVHFCANAKTTSLPAPDPVHGDSQHLPHYQLPDDPEPEPVPDQDEPEYIDYEDLTPGALHVAAERARLRRFHSLTL